MNHKKALFILALISLTLFAFLFPLFFYKKSNLEIISDEKKISLQNIEKEEPIKDSIKEINELYLKAIELNDEGLCLDIPSSKDKDYCLKEISQKKENTSICKEIENENIFNECVDYTKFFVAQKSKNTENCKDINDSYLKLSCVSSIINEAENCDSFLDENYLYCIDSKKIKKAFSSNDPDICDEIISIETREECLSVFR